MTQRITEKGRLAKQRIVEIAAQVVRDRRVAHTTLHDIRSEAKVSSSQLFHYFPNGKAALLLAVLHFEIDEFFAGQEQRLAAIDSWEAWAGWCEYMVSCYTGGSICGFGLLVSQIDPTDADTKRTLQDMQARWEMLVCNSMRAMQNKGLVATSVDASSCAAALIAGIQGGLVMMQNTGSSHYLEAVFVQTTKVLRAGG